MHRKVPDELNALNLSPRLLDVLARLMVGHSNKSIASDLDLSRETVKEYVAVLLAKFDVGSRAQIPELVRPYHDALLAWRVDPTVPKLGEHVRMDPQPKASVSSAASQTTGDRLAFAAS